MSNPFRFKTFSLFHSKSAQKIGTDSVLLGCFALKKNYSRVLDVGCGCGILSFMLATQPHEQIQGIDIDEISIEEAEKNLNVFPFNHALNFKTIRFQDFSNTESFDFIISNPPYFKNSLKSPTPQRNLARHNDTLTFDEFAENANRCLTPKGTIALILPVNEMKEMSDALAIQNLYPVEEILILPYPNALPNRCIRFFSRVKKNGIQNSTFIIRNENNCYSEEYLELVKDFLTIF